MFSSCFFFVAVIVLPIMTSPTTPLSTIDTTTSGTRSDPFSGIQNTTNSIPQEPISNDAPQPPTRSPPVTEKITDIPLLHNVSPTLNDTVKSVKEAGQSEVQKLNGSSTKTDQKNGAARVGALGVVILVSLVFSGVFS
ncbi:hypothetical protein ABEB36_002279 [Hypothenemus hampei]|uniref:Uncharacterized protein n=1 Tax=Hypothenemus hampei TaxID=57062 RepID=A0ABD1F561_HYPHA